MRPVDFYSMTPRARMMMGLQGLLVPTNAVDYRHFSGARLGLAPVPRSMARVATVPAAAAALRTVSPKPTISLGPNPSKVSSGGVAITTSNPIVGTGTSTTSAPASVAPSSSCAPGYTDYGDGNGCVPTGSVYAAGTPVTSVPTTSAQGAGINCPAGYYPDPTGTTCIPTNAPGEGTCPAGYIDYGDGNGCVPADSLPPTSPDVSSIPVTATSTAAATGAGVATGSLSDTLQQPLGPLPLWAWLLGAAGLAGFFFFRRKH